MERGEEPPPDAFTMGDSKKQPQQAKIQPLSPGEELYSIAMREQTVKTLERLISIKSLLTRRHVLCSKAIKPTKS